VDLKYHELLQIKTKINKVMKKQAPIVDEEEMIAQEIQQKRSARIS